MQRKNTGLRTNMNRAIVNKMIPAAMMDIIKGTKDTAVITITNINMRALMKMSTVSVLSYTTAAGLLIE